MRLLRISCIFLLVASMFWLALPRTLNAQQRAVQHIDSAYANSPIGFSANRAASGIKEEIPDKYKDRYREWKNEFLSTESGRSDWSAFEQNAHFNLTIVVSCNDRNGAGTGKYKWTDSGELISATINLGCRLDEGYPNPIYYPVMNSLCPRDSWFGINGSILAATKMAHEFGHVKWTSKTDGALYQNQNLLMVAYNKILLSNGRNPDDPRLLELSRRMGGTPVQIWENREYWGEVNAMRYLRDRIVKDSEKRALFTRIIHTVDLYAKDYAGRFDEIAKF